MLVRKAARHFTKLTKKWFVRDLIENDTHQRLPEMRGYVKDWSTGYGEYMPLAADVMTRVLTTAAPRFRDASPSDPSKPAPKKTDADILADYYLNACTNVGAYTENFGVRQVRENLARFLTQRDGVPTSFTNLRLCDNPIDDLKQISLLLSHDANNTFLLPAQPESLIQAALSDLRASTTGYSVEPSDFEVTMTRIAECYESARKIGKNPVAIFVNNPNDFGPAETRAQSIKRFVEFCYEKNLMIYSNESDFSLLPPGQPFYSIKSIIKTHPNSGLAANLESISVFSLPRFITPEWNHSGGFIEFSNIDPFAMEQIVKIMSMMLSGNTTSNIILDVLLTIQAKTDLVSAQTIEKAVAVNNKNKTDLTKATKDFLDKKEPVPGVKFSELPEIGSVRVTALDQPSLVKEKRSEALKEIEKIRLASTKKTLEEGEKLSVTRIASHPSQPQSYRISIKK